MADEISKEKQLLFYKGTKKLRQKILRDYSPTWHQIGRVDAIDFIKSQTKKATQVPNESDDAFGAWLDGVFKTITQIRELKKECDLGWGLEDPQPDTK